MERIKVVVTGACGKMGREVMRAVASQDDMELVGGVDQEPRDVTIDVKGAPRVIRATADLEEVIARLRPHVMVDFTRAQAAVSNARCAIERGVSAVIGTTGIPQEQVEELARLCERQGIGSVIAPNFAVGAVLMMKFCEMAARFFDAAEIIELHHEAKVDAPSGTAIKTAEMMNRARSAGIAASSNLSGEDRSHGEKPYSCSPRGAEFDGYRIHSVRLPGLVAHQEVIFGGQGQTLTIRHDSISRESFMPGVLLAVRRVRSLRGLVVGLDKLMEI
ncbi:MAG TPA: 4-hydroxy-tetrahydrodipicolinate reductase [Firmicutes bacterium]|nr:4-hydroxy-tetrahydrodipicolinate reductase [Bacillota bacterium]